MTSRSELDALLDRVRARCDEVGDCWEWRGALQQGTCTPTINYRGKPQGVRRLLMSQRGARSVAGRVVTYKCGNRLCVNPEHLTAIRRAELSSRSASGLNRACPSFRAHMQHMMLQDQRAKLSHALAAEIREKYAAGGVTQRDLGKEYGVTQHCIWQVVRGVTWRDFSNPFSQLLTLAGKP